MWAWQFFGLWSLETVLERNSGRVQKVFLQINRNQNQKKNFNTFFKTVGVAVLCGFGRGNMGNQLCPASLSISIAINKMLNFRKETIAKNKQEEHN